MILKSRSFTIAGLIALLLGGALWTVPAATAKTPFDGDWSVLIVTDSGDCDRAYRYAVRIADGNVSYPDQSVDISGHINPRGQVSVSVKAGDQYASGSGQISGNSGSGNWNGYSLTSRCSGHWQAQRRG